MQIAGKEKRPKRASKLSVVEVIDKKFQRKSELKEKELELRRVELELQKRKMDLEEADRKRADEERKERTSLEFEERRLMLQLLQKLAGGKDNEQ